jgi:hypothetical protein
VTYSSARKPLAVLICLGLLAVVVVGCSSPGGTSTGKTVNVGEAVTIDNLKYTVTAVNTTKEIGKPGNNFTMKNGDFVVLDMEVENVGEKETAFDGEMAKVMMLTASYTNSIWKLPRQPPGPMKPKVLRTSGSEL